MKKEKQFNLNESKTFLSENNINFMLYIHKFLSKYFNNMLQYSKKKHHISII